MTEFNVGDELVVTFTATYGYPSTCEPGSHYVWTGEGERRERHGPIPADQIRRAPGGGNIFTRPTPPSAPAGRHPFRPAYNARFTGQCSHQWWSEDWTVERTCTRQAADPVHDIWQCADEACYHGDGPCACEPAP